MCSALELLKYNIVVNRTYLNSKHCLTKTDTCKLLAEGNDEIEEEKQGQQRISEKGRENYCQRSSSTKNTQKTMPSNVFLLSQRVKTVDLHIY